MRRLLLPLTLALVATNLAASNVDLTPRYTETEIDGIRSKQLYVLENSRKIGLSIDQETTVGANGSGMVFRFPKLAGSSFRIGASPLTPEDLFSDPETLKRYQKAALELVPAGATEATILEEKPDPLPINRWTGRRFLISYQAGAALMRLEVTFLNVNASSQLLLVTSAPPRIFAEAADRSFQIIRSWHEMLPGDEIANRGN